MNGWLIETTTPRPDGGEPDAEYYAVWIADREAALAAVAGRPEVGGEPPPVAVEPLGENALRTYGAAPGGSVRVPAPSS